jgi:hypothetical protein
MISSRISWPPNHKVPASLVAVFLPKKGTLRRHHQGISAERANGSRRGRWRGKSEPSLSNAMLDQSPAQIDVVGKRLAGAPLSKPLLIDEFRKPAKTKCGNVNRIALASRRSFKEIAPASGTGCWISGSPDSISTIRRSTQLWLLHASRSIGSQSSNGKNFYGRR